MVRRRGTTRIPMGHRPGTTKAVRRRAARRSASAVSVLALGSAPATGPDDPLLPRPPRIARAARVFWAYTFSRSGNWLPSLGRLAMKVLVLTLAVLAASAIPAVAQKQPCRDIY